MIRLYQILLLNTILTLLAYGADTSRPIGVGPDLAKYYKSEQEFSCIFNPSLKIKPSQVNDNICDCPDGSDEPGTAACTHISDSSSPQPFTRTSYNSSLAIPGFYCKNKDHIPAYIPNMYVNDGVCDYQLCCDGSDEWTSVGGIKCKDRCKDAGKKWKQDNEIRQNILRAGLIRRAELVSDSHALKAELQTSKKKLENEIKLKEKEVANLKKTYEEAERRERGHNLGNAENTSKLSTLATVAKKRIEQLRQTLSGLVSERDLLVQQVRDLEAILSTFKEEYNPNFNDEGVKRAVKSWEDYAANKKSKEIENSATEDYDLDELLEVDSEEHGINWNKWLAEENSNPAVLYKFEEYLPTAIRNWSHTKLIDLRIFLMDHGILAEVKSNDFESKSVKEAREAFQAASDDLSRKKTTLGHNEADLTKDYGLDDVFRAMKGRCIEKDSGEYTYELCWLEGTKQKSKNSGSHTNMGSFVTFDKILVDEEISDTGKGLGSGERIALIYKNGQSCWNGPNRETVVILGCSDKDEIWKTSESEKCIYRMEVGSPAACKDALRKKEG